MKGKFAGLLIALFVLAMSATLGFGQVTATGSLSGTVTDPQGSVVPGATVVVKSVATGREFTTETNSEGAFQVPGLQEGEYTATITRQGFKQAVVTAIKINVSQPSSIAVGLEVGAASEVVTVVGGGELLQTQTATVGTTIQGRQITNLPYASRNALDLLLFLPGTATAGRPRQSTVNGLPKAMLNVTLDGLNIQDNVLKGSDGFFTLIQPKTDAVQEVSVSTSTPGAESNAEGAVQIKFTTRSGGSEYHGSVYWEHRDKSLNGNFFWNNMLLAPKPHFGKPPSPNDKAPRTNALLNQPGARVGGPIKIPHIFNSTRKGFFFINYEEYRLPEAQLRTRTVLSPNAIAGLFQFGSTQVNVYNLAIAGGFTGAQSTPDPTIAALMTSIRAVPGSFTNTSDPNIQQLTFTNQGGQKRRFPTARFDFELNKKNHIETIYNYQIFRSKVDFLNNADPFAPGFPNFGSQDSNRYSSSTAWRTQIRNNIVNEARFGVQNGIVLFFPQNNPGQFVNQGGVSQGINVAASGISNVTTVNNAQRRNTPTNQFSDNLSWVKGKHTLNFGGDMTSVSTFLAQTPNFVGVVPTAGYGQDTSDPIESVFCVGAAPCGPFATATQAAQADTLYRVLTGRLTSVSYAASLNEAGSGYVRDVNIQRFRQREIGVYGQDSWRFRPNLTVNFGLRLETVYAPISQNKALTQNTFAGLFGTSGSDLSALFKPGATAGSATSFSPLPPGQHLYNTAHNWAPTVGFAYQPNFKTGFLKTVFGSSGKTVIRGGWSMAFDREGLNLTSSIVGTNFGGQLDLTQFSGSAFTRGTLFRNLPGAPVAPGTIPTTPSIFYGNAPGAPPGTPKGPQGDSASANAFLPNLKTPYVISFSGSIQREITKDMVIEIGYIGNRGHQLLRQFNLNEVNIIENGFANEVRNAASNLRANIAGGAGCGGGTTFRYSNCAGTVPLPLFLAFFQGLPAASATNQANYTSSRFGSSTFTARLTPSNLQALGIAGILAQFGGVSANDCDPVAAGVQGCPYMLNAANGGLPSNFFVVNPVMFNNFGAGNGSFLVNNDGKTWYDALTIELRRRLSKGVLANFNYTFSKALGNEFVSSSIAFLQPATIRNTWLNKVASPFDIRSSLKGSFIGELPFGRGRHFGSNLHGIWNGLAGDWTLNGTVRVSSGVPLNLGNVQLVGMTAKELENAIKIRKTTVVTNTTTGAIGPAVFWLPQDIVDNTRRAFNTCVPGTANCTANGYGTGNLSGGPLGFTTGGDPSGRYIAPAGDNCLSTFTGQCGFTQLIVHGPRFTRVDFGIEKKIKFSETKDLEFRFEFLNFFNNIDFRLGSFNNDTVTIGANNATNGDIPTYTLSGFGQLLGSNTAYRDVSTTNDPGGRVGQIVVRFNF